MASQFRGGWHKKKKKKKDFQNEQLTMLTAGSLNSVSQMHNIQYNAVNGVALWQA